MCKLLAVYRKYQINNEYFSSLTLYKIITEICNNSQFKTIKRDYC